MQTLTLKQAKATLAKYSVTINWKRDSEEYRVNLAGAKEATAYYTNDLYDALNTGIAMAQPQLHPVQANLRAAIQAPNSPFRTYLLGNVGFPYTRTWARYTAGFSTPMPVIYFTDKH